MKNIQQVQKNVFFPPKFFLIGLVHWKNATFQESESQTLQNF